MISSQLILRHLPNLRPMGCRRPDHRPPDIPFRSHPGDCRHAAWRRGQQAAGLPTIGVVVATGVTEPLRQAIRHGLREHGYVEG